MREESWLAAAQESTLGEKWLMIALKWKLWNNSTFVQVQFEKFSTVIYTLSKLHLVLIIKLSNCIYHFVLTYIVNIWIFSWTVFFKIYIVLMFNHFKMKNNINWTNLTLTRWLVSRAADSLLSPSLVVYLNAVKRQTEISVIYGRCLQYNNVTRNNKAIIY